MASDIFSIIQYIDNKGQCCNQYLFPPTYPLQDNISTMNWRLACESGKVDKIIAIFKGKYKIK